MSLPGSKLNTLFQISNKVFGRGVEEYLKGSGNTVSIEKSKR